VPPGRLGPGGIAWAHGITALLTTQYLEEADALSDGIVVIDRGEVIADGTAEELKRAVSVRGYRIAAESSA
jgi:ABC-type multidrug transport system ATPase subunit